MVHIISKIGPVRPKISQSPIKEMYRMAWLHNMGYVIWEAILYGPMGSFDDKKKLTKQLIWDNEIQRWKSTCLLYRNLDCYQNTVQDIRILAWWKYARKKKTVKKRQVSCVVALLLGCQPKGMQSNFLNHFKMCDGRQHDSPLHVLMKCPCLSELRNAHIPRIQASMPTAMSRCFVSL